MVSTRRCGSSPPPMPSIPPILDTPSSRMIYFDIDEEQLHGEVLHAGDTAWLTVSGAVLNSEQDFPDTTFIEVKTHLNTAAS